MTRNFQGDRVNLIDARRIVGDAARPFGEPIELVAAAVRRRAVRVAEQTDRVDRRLAQFRRLFNLLLGHHAGVVVSIGDDEEHPAIPPGVIAQVGLRRLETISERRPADRVDARDAHFQFVPVGRQRHVEPGLVAEIEHEHFVLRVGRARERERRRLDFRPQRPHAAAVVDHQAERHRDVLTEKQCDRLALPVLVDGERASRQVRHELAATVLHGRTQDDEPRFRAKRRRLSGNDGANCHRGRERERKTRPHGCAGPGAI